MSKDPKEKAALSLERKILRAIERGEFVPLIGYLMDNAYLSRFERVLPIGPCGCLIAAAASVCGLKGSASQETLIQYLAEHGVPRADSMALENAYEDNYEGHAPADVQANPYYQVGARLRRFHPHLDGRAATCRTGTGRP